MNENFHNSPDSISPDISADAWDACPAGALAKVARTARAAGAARQMKANLRNRLLTIGAGSVSALALVALVGAMFINQTPGPAPAPHEYFYGGVSCSRVQDVFGEYQAGGLDPQLQRQVTIHLAKCTVCGPLYDQMQIDMCPVDAEHQACDCPDCGSHSSSLLVVNQ